MLNRSSPAASGLAALAHEAYVFTLPLVVMETLRRRRMALGPMNQMFHARRLLTHKSREITTPNNDTLYSNAWIDLRDRPARIELPAAGGRYLSVALMDMWTDNFAVLGGRATGAEGGVFTIIGPDDAARGLEGQVIRAPTPVIWVLARILVDGPQDLAAAREVQNGLRLEAAPPRNGPEGDPAEATRSAPWEVYFAQAARLMATNRPRATDLALLRRIAPLGLEDGEAWDPARFSSHEAQEIEAGVAAAKARLRTGIGGGLGGGAARAGGWAAPSAKLGLYGEDYALRARVAVGGLGALPLVEATYFSAAAFGGVPLDGRRPMRSRIPGDAPLPVDAFWSLSMYAPTDDGELFFVDNPIDRYAIGDRTPGLETEADGSLVILIGHADPGDGRRANWLPAPDGPCTLVLRAYHPRRELLDGRRMPPEPEPIFMEETDR